MGAREVDVPREVQFAAEIRQKSDADGERRVASLEHLRRVRSRNSHNSWKP